MTQDNITPDNRPTNVETSGQDQWERDFPKSYDEAVARVDIARTDYHGLPMPEGDFVNTPIRPISELLKKRGALLEASRSPTRGIWENVEVPAGFENWALKKMELAHNLWTARAMESLITERQMPKTPETIVEKPDEATKIADPEMSEVVDVMMGDFRVDIIDGKPKLVTTSYGELFMEGVKSIESRHREWVAKHEGTLVARFPKLSGFLELLSNIKPILKNLTDLELIGNIFLAYYFAHYRKKIRTGTETS